MAAAQVGQLVSEEVLCGECYLKGNPNVPMKQVGQYDVAESRLEIVGVDEEDMFALVQRWETLYFVTWSCPNGHSLDRIAADPSVAAGCP